jgi:hypothetical protein
MNRKHAAHRLNLAASETWWSDKRTRKETRIPVMYEPRRPQVYIGQDAILTWMKEEKLIATLLEIAQHFKISEASARRKADGLVAQGKLIVEDGGRGRHGWLRRYGINLDAETGDDEAPRRLEARADQ